MLEDHANKGDVRIIAKLWQLLNHKQRVSAGILLALMFVGMILEMLGVGLVLPALALMTGTGVGKHTRVITNLLPNLGAASRPQFVIYGMTLLVAVYAVKSAFLVFLAWWQMRFVYGAQAEISNRLFNTYLRQPYAFHLQRNSALLINNVISEVHLLCQAMLLPVLFVITEAMVLIGLLAVLLIVEPRGTLIVLAIISAVALSFHFGMHAAVLRWGAARQMHEGRRLIHLQQGLGGIKDVLVLGRESEFLRQFQVHNAVSAMASQKMETLNQMPRLGLELVAVLGLSVLVLINVRAGVSIDTILPTIGLFAAAAFRIMPSVNRIINSLHNLRYGRPVLASLHKELSLPTLSKHERAPALPFEVGIRLVELSYTYAGATTQALNAIRLTIRRGTTVGFIGGSGAGKSTLVDVLLGLLPPDHGRVEVDESDIGNDLRGWQRNIGYVPQSIFLIDDSLRRNIAFGVPEDSVDDTAVWRAICAAQLEEYVKELPEGLNTFVGERGVRISGGQLQRIGIARALYNDPPVLVLDEATSSLDGLTERGVMQAVNNLHGRKTIIIVAHRVSTLQDCDWIFRLERGCLVAEGDFDTMIRGGAAKGGAEAEAVQPNERSR